MRQGLGCELLAFLGDRGARGATSSEAIDHLLSHGYWFVEFRAFFKLRSLTDRGYLGCRESPQRFASRDGRPKFKYWLAPFTPATWDGLS